MRPDQHKKKKNLDYKKKHGIHSEKGEKHDKKGSTSRHRSDEKPESEGSKTGLETDGTNVNTGSTSHESGNFSRRKVESNWERYKEDFDDESEQTNGSPAININPIGADFQSLLDKAATGGSHFQFKSEKEWENLDMAEANKDGPSLLSIDCHALAESLQNIPLEQRLDLDKKYSIEDEYSKPNENKIEPDQQVINYHTNGHEITKNNNDKPQKTFTETSNKNQEDQCPLQSQTSSNSEGKMEKHKVHKMLSHAEDDLELLLETGNNKSSPTHMENKTGIQARPTGGHTNQVNATTAQKPAKDSKEDLEDWLDSILD